MSSLASCEGNPEQANKKIGINTLKIVNLIFINTLFLMAKIAKLFWRQSTARNRKL